MSPMRRWRSAICCARKSGSPRPPSPMTRCSRASATIKPHHWTLFYYRGIAERAQRPMGSGRSRFQEGVGARVRPALRAQLSRLHLGRPRRKIWTRRCDMLNKAVEQRPDDGYIVDSLGWAYYMIGDYAERGRDYLERAVEFEPTDSDDQRASRRRLLEDRPPRRGEIPMAPRAQLRAGSRSGSRRCSRSSTAASATIRRDRRHDGAR